MWCRVLAHHRKHVAPRNPWRDVLLVVLTAAPPRAPSARRPERRARAAAPPAPPRSAPRPRRPRYPIRLGRRSRSVRERVCRAVTTYDTSSAPSNQHASTPASDHTAANDPPYIVCRIASTE